MNKRNNHKELNLDELQNETLVVHADDWVTNDRTLAPAIYYSATFRADNAAEFAEMAGTPRHPQYYTIRQSSARAGKEGNGRA